MEENSWKEECTSRLNVHKNCTISLIKTPAPVAEIKLQEKRND
jgi:hypothetical protein